MAHKGFAVVIAKHPCMLKFTRERRQKMPERAIKDLKEYVASKEKPLKPWYAIVVKFLCDEMGEEEFLASAKDQTPFRTAQRRCEAFFYAATLRRIAGDEEGARDLFKKCVATNVRDFIEYQSATMALRLR